MASKKKAIIMDIDGTLADTASVPEYQYSSVDWEAWNENNVSASAFDWAVDLTNLYHQAGYEIVFLTSRDYSKRSAEATRKWLKIHLPDIPTDNLFMRSPGDFRSDYLVKVDLYIDHVRPEFDVKLFVDDKLSNCRAFRGLGIPSLCCSEHK